MKISLKHTFLALGAIALLTGCDENDWNDKLDGFEVPPTYGVTETINYQLTSADYTTIAGLSDNKAIAEAAGEAEVAALEAIGKNGCFVSEEQARKYIPAYLESTSFPYFTLNNGSSVKVTYNMAGNQPAQVLGINNNCTIYRVNDGDYQSAWGSDEDYIQAFAPMLTPAENIPAILGDVLEAKDGDYAAVEYNWSATNPVFGNGGGTVTPAAPYFGKVSTIASGGKYLMVIGESYGAMISASSSYGRLSLTAATFNGDKLEADAVNAITITEVPGKGYTLVDSENRYLGMDDSHLTSFQLYKEANDGCYWTVTWVDGTARFANNLNTDCIICRSTGTDGTPYTNVAPAKVAEGQTLPELYMYVNPSKVRRGAPVAPVATSKEVALYEFKGSWEPVKDALVLQPSDYTAMGQTYENLSGTSPETLLPIYLKQRLPYAAAGESKVVAYKYYDGTSTAMRANLFEFDSSEWKLNFGATTDQFTRDNGKFVYNPSVIITLPYKRNTDPSYTYFMKCLDWVFENVTKKLDPDATPANGTQPGPIFIDYRGNAEFYSGASAFYGNVDVRAATAKSHAPTGYTEYDGLSDDEISNLLVKRFCLETMHYAVGVMNPDAKPVDGIEVTYTFNVTFYVNGGSAQEHSVVYTVTGPGEFKYKSCSWFKNGEDKDW